MSKNLKEEEWPTLSKKCPYPHDLNDPFAEYEWSNVPRQDMVIHLTELSWRVHSNDQEATNELLNKLKNLSQEFNRKLDKERA